jgi:hypothetical protein
VIRDDGLDRKAWLERKLEKREDQQARQARLSDEYYEKAQKDRDFLSLAEPIKVGHHSEKRHRKLLDDNWGNMGKSVEEATKQRALTTL